MRPVGAGRAEGTEEQYAEARGGWAVKLLMIMHMSRADDKRSADFALRTAEYLPEYPTRGYF